ncbi:MAG: hypothetical protein M0021_09790 [Clostridia bacterium]|nr:hypothetical protein [Clostridia bacterium]
MATKVFPTVNDVGSAGSGKTITEANLIAWLKALIAQNFVVSGFTVPASSVDLTLSIALGQACIDGRRVDIDTATTVTCTANATNHIYLKLTKDASQNVTGAVFEVNTTGVAPADSVKICTAVAGASSISSTADARVLYPFAYSQMPYVAINKAGDTMTGKLTTLLGDLGTAVGSTIELNEVTAGVDGNSVRLIARLRRTADGVGWSTAAIDILRRTDITDQGYITFHPDGTLQYNGNTVYHASNKSDIIATGTYSDTTTSIVASGTYTLNIPIGTSKSQVRILWNGYAGVTTISDYMGGEIVCTANNLETVAFWVIDVNNDFTRSTLRSELGYVAEGFGATIRCTECYISGTNLVMVFSNTDTGAAQTLRIDKLHWMAV